MELPVRFQFRKIFLPILLSAFLFGRPLKAQVVVYSQNFESGNGGFLFNSFSISTGFGFNGSKCLLSKRYTPANFIATPAIPLLASKPYRFTLKAKAQTGNLWSYKIYYNTSNTLNGNEVLLDSSGLIPNVWKTYSHDFVDKPAGNYYFILKCSGNPGIWADMYFDDFALYDWGNYRPTISFTTLTNGFQQLSGTPLPIALTTSDPDGQVVKVKLYYNGFLFDTKTTQPFNFTIDDLPYGNNALYAVAFDNLGDSASTPIVNITGINAAPSCQLLVPQADTIVSQGDSVTIRIAAADLDGMVKSVTFFSNGIPVSIDTAFPFVYTKRNLSAGIHSIYGRARDNAGLTANSDTISVQANPTSYGYLFFENFEDGDGNWEYKGPGLNKWFMAKGLGFNNTDCYRRNSSGKGFLLYAYPLYLSPGTYTFRASFKSVNSPLSYSVQPVLVTSTDTLYGALSSPITNTAWREFFLTIEVTSAGYYQFGLEAPTASGYINLYMDDAGLMGAGGTPNAPPVVRINTPVKGLEVNLNTPVTIDATAYDIDGRISRVQFYGDQLFLGESSTPPYTRNWTPAHSGIHKVRIKATDSLGKVTVVDRTLLVSYSDRKVFGIAASSYLGAEAGSGQVYGTVIQKDGTIALACDWGTSVPDSVVVHRLNGATHNSRGAVVRISSDGKKILSITRIGDHSVDISMDAQDNLYVAAGSQGVVKLNPQADKLLLAKPFPMLVHRVDAGKTGYIGVLTSSVSDFEAKKLNPVSTFLLNPQGMVIGSFGTASVFTNDICIDEATQSVVIVGWRNTFTPGSIGTPVFPVDIPGLKIFGFNGGLRYAGYNWSADVNSPDWVNRSENNMADSRLSRCIVGEDGYLYIAGEPSGGNHQFRYSPYNIMQKVKLVLGDKYHNLYNTGTEFHTFIGRMDLATGEFLLGQTFTNRLTNGRGNTINVEGGAICVDKEGRVSFTGDMAAGAPLTQDSMVEPSGYSYTGGAFIYIMDPTLQVRELVDRVTLKNKGLGIATRKFENGEQSFVYGGKMSYTLTDTGARTLFRKNHLQFSFLGGPEQVCGFFALIGGKVQDKYLITADGQLLGSFPERTKIVVPSPPYFPGNPFLHWSGGGNYLNDSTLVSPVLSVPGRNMNLLPVYQFPTSISQAIPALIKIYPNPVKDQLYIETRLNEPLVVTLQDVTGRVVASEKVLFSASWFIGHLPKGIYLLSGGKTKEKIIVE